MAKTLQLDILELEKVFGGLMAILWNEEVIEAKKREISGDKKGFFRNLGQHFRKRRAL